METKTIVRLKVLSKLKNAAELSQLIGFECDTSWIMGEPRVKGATIKHDKNGWILNSGCPDSTPLEEQLIALLNRLQPAATELRQIAQAHEVELSCVLYSDIRPELNFSSEIIQRAAAVGASLDVDLYLG